MWYVKTFALLCTLAVSIPAFAGEKSRRHASRSPASLSSVQQSHTASLKKSSDLGRVYETVMRDTRKHLTPSTSPVPLYVAAPQNTASGESAFHVAAHSEPSRLLLPTNTHAAMPWAAQGTFSGAQFSMK